MIKFMGQYGRPNLALAGILVNHLHPSRIGLSFQASLSTGTCLLILAGLSCRIVGVSLLQTVQISFFHQMC